MVEPEGKLIKNDEPMHHLGQAGSSGLRQS